MSASERPRLENIGGSISPRDTSMASRAVGDTGSAPEEHETASSIPLHTELEKGTPQHIMFGSTTTPYVLPNMSTDDSGNREDTLPADLDGLQGGVAGNLTAHAQRQREHLSALREQVDRISDSQEELIRRLDEMQATGAARVRPLPDSAGLVPLDDLRELADLVQALQDRPYDLLIMARLMEESQRLARIIQEYGDLRRAMGVAQPTRTKNHES